MEEGDTANSFDKDLALALAPKMCPDQSQAFIEVNNSQAFTVGRYSSCRYNERQLIDVTVVRRVRLRAERSCDTTTH